MFSPSGIYPKIEKLDEAKTVKELVALLKPILNELAYYSITGDGAVMEMREDWHNTFTDYMYEAAGSNVQPPQRQQQPQQQQQMRQQPQQQMRQQSQMQSQMQAQMQAQPQMQPQMQAQPKQQQQLNRPDPRNLPYSLSAIMNGTHSSFSEM